MSRDSIRKALLGAKSEFKKEVVSFNGVKVEIRQPSVRSRKEIMKKATDDKGNVDTFEFLVHAVVENTYVEGSSEKVFEPEDYEALLEKPVGGFMDKFGEVAANLMNVEESVSEKAKN